MVIIDDCFKKRKIMLGRLNMLFGMYILSHGGAQVVINEFTLFPSELRKSLWRPGSIQRAKTFLLSMSPKYFQSDGDNVWSLPRGPHGQPYRICSQESLNFYWECAKLRTSNTDGFDAVRIIVDEPTSQVISVFNNCVEERYSRASPESEFAKIESLV